MLVRPSRDDAMPDRLARTELPTSSEPARTATALATPRTDAALVRR